MSRFFLYLIFFIFFALLNAKPINIIQHQTQHNKTFTIITSPHLAGIKIEIKTSGFMLEQSFYFIAHKLKYSFLANLDNDKFEELYLLLEYEKAGKTYTQVVGLVEYGNLIAKKIKIIHPNETNYVFNNTYILDNNYLINTFMLGDKQFKYFYLLTKQANKNKWVLRASKTKN